MTSGPTASPSATPAVPSTALPRLLPGPLPGLDPTWSRHVGFDDADGVRRTAHALDTGGDDPVGTLLCVHGNPTWSYLWRRLLAAPPAGWRVVAPDHLGMGLSERVEGPRPLARRIDDLARITTALGVTGPVVTVAHDWGGPISLGWALAHRDDLRGVVLTNTAVHQPGHVAAPALIRLAHVPAVRGLACVRTPVFVRGAAALSRPALPKDVRDALAAPYRGPDRRRSVGDFVADIPFAPGHPSWPALDAVADGIRSLDVPALLLWGPRDPVFGEAHLADLRERLPHAAVHRFEGASHLLAEDAPQYAGIVSRWVGDLGDLPVGDGGNGHGEAGAPADGEDAGSRRVWTALAERSDDASPAVVEVDGAAVTWAELASRVAATAAGLAAAGVRPGDRVALLVPPSVDLTTAVYALWRAGAVVVVVDRGLGLAAMGRALRGAGVDHVVGTPAGLAAARAMRVPGRRIAAGTAPAAVLRALGATTTLADLRARGSGLTAPSEPPADAECAVVFTSGATGPPKGVVYRHRQVQAQLELVRSTYALDRGDRIVAAFAPFALLGPALGIGSSVPRTDVTAPATLTAVALAEAAAAVDATVVFASPAALRNVLATAGDLSAVDSETLSRVRLLMSAGAPVPVPLLRRLAGVLPAAELHTPYGMTEVLPVTDVSLADLEADLASGPVSDADPTAGGGGVCVGVPLPGVDVAVSAVDGLGRADGPPDQAPGVTGEVCVRAAHVKDRYDALWATERTSSRDAGWHRTGDVGHLDDRGRLWVEGRLGHVVATERGVVTPVAVEQRVEILAGVASAAAVGVGPPGAQRVVVVAVPAGSPPRRGRPLAEPGLAADVRAVAGVDVAAVLVARSLPVDVRHASKVDRASLAAWAAGVLAGA